MNNLDDFIFDALERLMDLNIETPSLEHAIYSEAQYLALETV